MRYARMSASVRHDSMYERMVARRGGILILEKRRLTAVVRVFEDETDWSIFLMSQ